MGNKKKKTIRKDTKHINDQDILDAVREGKAAEAASKVKSSELTNDQLFASNTSKPNLKKIREKLKDDRFKEIESVTRSKVEEVLIKRINKATERKEEQGLPVKKQRLNQEKKEAKNYGGDLEDLWGSSEPF